MDQIISDDLQLLQAFARERDEEVFAQIVGRYKDVVYTACLRVLSNQAQAEEAAQETFLRLVQQPGAVQRSLGGWLYRTATQVAIDMVRRDSSRRSREGQYVQTQQREALNWEDLSPAIDGALEELPAGQRTLLVDHFILGVSQRELATRTGLSPATLSRRMHESLDALRELLHKRGLLVATAAALAGIMSQAVCKAAPATLTRELGKLAMVSGAASQGTTMAGALSGAGAIAKTATMALLALVAATLIVLGVWRLMAWSESLGPAPSAPDRSPQNR